MFFRTANGLFSLASISVLSPESIAVLMASTAAWTVWAGYRE